jgi:hypothetical protein
MWSRWQLAPAFPGCSVPLTGPGLTGCGVEVPGLLDPGLAFCLDLRVPGDVQAGLPGPRQAASWPVWIQWQMTLVLQPSRLAASATEISPSAPGMGRRGGFTGPP